ncbi:MAG TPA: S8 family serine peptidase [Patescibacteria group bacterium]|nr:S8 family serine peptidase [Patescibacteria group bacterium]
MDLPACQARAQVARARVTLSRTAASRAALALAVIAALMMPAAGVGGSRAWAEGPALVVDLVSRPDSGSPRSTARPLRSLPSSLLVTLRPGADLGVVDAAAATRGLVRVAWNPTLHTAQYVVGGGEPAGRERSQLARLGTELARTGGVVAARPPIRLVILEDPTPAPEATATPDPTPAPSPEPTGSPPPTPAPAPNDPLWGHQWGPEAVGARTAWAWTRGRPEIVVAVLDTGVDLAHPDLAGRLVPGTDVGSGDGDPSDEDGHGTHVAGIVVAASGNGIGVSGVAPEVVVMPVKVMGDDGNIWEPAVAEGITWAVTHGARVINLSLGGEKESPAINAAIDAARAEGVVVVAAAGNHSEGGSDPGVDQPGAHGPALTVAAVEDSGDVLSPPGSAARYTRASYSNTGPQVDLAAPGSSILSTGPTGAGDAYRRMSGTSMATSFVSAAAALVLSRKPSLTAGQVEAALLATASDLGPAGPDPETGAGLVNAGAAVASVPAPPSDGAAPTVRIGGLADGTAVHGTLALTVLSADASPVLATRLYRDGAYQLVRRTGTVAMSWNTAGSPDGLRRWQAFATDAGLNVGSASARVLVANRRTVTTLRTSLLMTATNRSITRRVTVPRTSPLVARFWGPGSSRYVVRVVDSAGRVVAEARGTGAAAIALTSLPAGTYTIRALTPAAVPGRFLRLSAAWFR